MASQTKPTISIVIRSLNEEKWVGQAMAACHDQLMDDADIEIVLVDSGSTDQTVEIAKSHNAQITYISKSEFTFGRSLNYGCEAARGDYLVFISAHCIPASQNWLRNLVAPLILGEAEYVYGRQIGNELSKFSECQVFDQYFPAHDKLPEENGFFANNANSALLRSTWEKHGFDEAVTGLEDMVLGKAIVADGGKVAYAPDAPVVHIHEETFSQVRRRYYREALTLREIMPEVHFHRADFIRYFSAGVLHDLSVALEERVLVKHCLEIVAFRFMQYWGTYLGHNEHRTLSRAQKESYYYPGPKKRSGGKTRENSHGTVVSATTSAD